MQPHRLARLDCTHPIELAAPLERGARERAQAFEKLTNAQDRTNQSVDQLKSEIGRVSGAVAAMEATLDKRFDELFAEVGARARASARTTGRHQPRFIDLTSCIHTTVNLTAYAGPCEYGEDHRSDAGG